MVLQTPVLPQAESVAARRARLLREAESIAVGRAEISQGEGVGLEGFDAWLGELDADGDAPFPAPHGDVVRS